MPHIRYLPVTKFDYKRCIICVYNTPSNKIYTTIYAIKHNSDRVAYRPYGNNYTHYHGNKSEIDELFNIVEINYNNGKYDTILENL